MSGEFFPAPEAIVRELGPAPAVLYGRIWRYCQGGGTCYASLATLARECNAGERTIRRWISDLAERGYITASSGGTSGTTSTLTTTRKWVMGGGGQDVQGGGGQNGRGGRSEWPGGVGQNGHLLKESEEKKKENDASASKGTTRDTAAAKTKTTTSRPAKPLFDAFRAAFLKSSVTVAGQFDSACVKAGLTVDDWHAFMASPKARQDYLDGYLTQGNALNRFNAWASEAVKRAPGQDSESAHIQRMGAPTNWRDIVYAPGGVKRAPFLALPRMGLEPYAPPASWPAWYREFEGVNA